MCNNLVSRLIERGICTRRKENDYRFFSLHKLVKQSIELFVEEAEKLEFLQ